MTPIVFGNQPPGVDYPFTLLPHPATPAPMIRGLEAQAGFLPDGTFVFRYRLRGDMARLRVPQEKNSADRARTDLLWEHTCFEAFVGVSGETAYREFNFSPSGQWAAYAFSGYRQGLDAPLDMEAPRIEARLTDGRLELDARIAEEALPRCPEGRSWQIGLSAVVEATDTVDGSHSYWALKHPSPRPDFHRRESFTLEIRR